MKKINVSLMGCGYWGPNLLRNLISNTDCEVLSVVEPSQDRRDYVKQLYPRIKVTPDAGEVFGDGRIEAVVVASPVSTHYELALAALNSGKHILVEKPIATSVSEVDRIDRISRENGLVAMTGHTFIYNQAVRYLKRIMDDKELGDIRYIYSQRLNLGRIRSDVDALWNFAPHDISIIQFLLNDPDPISVTSRGMDYVQSGIDDVVFMTVEYPGKIMANIHVSWLDPRKIRRMTIVGTRKMVVYDDIAENKISIYDKGIDRMAVLGEHMDFDNPSLFSFNHRSGDVIMPKIEWEEPLKIEIAHFFDCILNKTRCLTDTQHAKKVVRILALGSKDNP